MDAVVHTCLLFSPSSETCSGRLRRNTIVSDWSTGSSAAGEKKVVALADLEAVLLDHVDDARLHRGHRRGRTVDGQRDRFVRRDRDAAREGQGEQRRTDQKSQ